MSSTSGRSRAASASAAPRMSVEKFGSSNRRSCDSVSRNAIEFARAVARFRAWGLMR